MVFLLNSTNVFDYLATHQLIDADNVSLAQIELLEAKNFNLLVTLSDGSKLLVKQERHRDGKSVGEFQREWQVSRFVHEFPELQIFKTFLTEILQYDQDNSILIVPYLENYPDLSRFYQQESVFPLEIASVLGSTLAILHRQTFKKSIYYDFLAHDQTISPLTQINHLLTSLERITPEIFGMIPDDGLKFFSLYQRYDSLGKSMVSLGHCFEPSCLTHNDLKLNNILVNYEGDSFSKNPTIKLIDLERANWGDPAYDLGTLIGSYLQLWLGSLVVNKSLTIDESLRLATIPLEILQPSLATIMQNYLLEFPKILEERPDFLAQVIQFTGLALIQQIQGMIQYQKTFSNQGIIMLQVAKKLLGYPHQSLTTIFGNSLFQKTPLDV